MAGRYCEVALPVPLRSTFTYAVPEALEESLQCGSRVVVPFGKRAMVGVAVGLSERRPAVEQVREVVAVLDPLPALVPALLELGRWMAGYYLAPAGEVFAAMLPPAADIRREREYSLTDAGRSRLAELQSLQNRSESQVTELALLQLLEVEGRLRPVHLRKLPGGEAAATRLVRRGCLDWQELARRRKARTQKVVAWNQPAASAPAEGPARKAHAVLTTVGPMPLRLLLNYAGISRAAAARLEKQGLLKSWEEPVAPEEEPFGAGLPAPANVLNAEQQRALDEVCAWLERGEFTVGLLHGITGSGKTEIYLRAVAACLARGRSALMLVPEIALTVWIARLFRAALGEQVAVLHSGLPEVERASEWWRVRRGNARVVVGTRSAVFAPLENVGLVIVDEEQEAAYKQEETPRYHGRDAAILRARLERAVALLGSATPSLETFYNARTGKYRLLQLECRVGNRPLAETQAIDLREEFQRTQRADPLSEKLRAEMAARLKEGTQTLLLLNRRGYSRFLLCRSCGAAVQCRNCSIALTYHKRRDRLVCHYCSYSQAVPKTCPKCQSQYIYFVGEGTEQIEERIRREFPSARVARLDRDTVRTKREYQKVLGAFAAGKLDVLVGTQMVAKGHDFQRVTLVGVISADLALALPDFRAAERTFQLLTQVAGRAGRGPLPGRVLVQTFYPEHYAIQCACRQDYEEFFEKELHFRRMMHYPPFTALANLVVRDSKLSNAIRWTRALERFFTTRAMAGIKVLGPASAPLARLKREYRFQFLLKSPRRKLLAEHLAASLDYCAKEKIPAHALLVDVDPVSLM